MSTTVDQRVVEMRFDNKQFESNVATSLTTIDKLKSALHLDGATKGLESIGAAAKNCDMSVLGDAVETVRLKFSAMEIFALTALQNIANSAINAGKKMVDALTIDPIKTGFQEYETQIGAIQTILANTSSKGTTLGDVNKALDELNHYADMTIYNFTEMTRNIGTFTAAGVDLDTSVAAIKGIANLAAVSGSTSQQASTAMYQLSQALASGTVKLMDWNSVVNAGMGGQVFQDALKQTAKVHGIAIDEMIEDEGSFRETLKNEWLTSDILTETLSKFTGDLTEAQILEMGYTEEETKAIMEMGVTANDAATKVKTFTQLFDTLKEAAQSGWTQSWQNIIGDYGEAKEFLTEVSDKMSAIINNAATERNDLLSGALNSNWKKLTNEINKAGVDTNTFEEKLKTLLTEHDYDVDQLVKDYGSLSNAFRDGGASSDILKTALDELKKSAIDAAVAEGNFSKAHAISDYFKRAAEASNEITVLGGRELLIESLRNAFEALMATMAPIKEAFREIFPATTAKQLYGFIEQIKSFSEKLMPTEETLEKLKTSFKGFFAVLDIGVMAVKAVAGGISELIQYFWPATSGILDLASGFSEYLIQLRNSVKESDIFNQIVGKIVSIIKDVASFVQLAGTSLKDFITVISEKFSIPGFEIFQDFLTRIGTRMQSITDTTKVVETTVSDSFKAMGEAVEKSAFMNVLHAMWNAIKSIGSAMGDLLGNIAKNLGEANFNNVIDLFNGLATGGLLMSVSNLINSKADEDSGIMGFFKNIAENGFFDGIKSSLDNVVEILDGVRDSLELWQTNLKADILKKIATAIGILAASILVISTIDSNKLASSLGAITGLFVELMGSMAVFQQITATSGKGVVKATSTMIAMSAAILILASAMTKLAKLNWEEIAKGLTGVAGLAVIMVAVAKALSSDTKKMIKGASGMIVFAAAIKILAGVCEDLALLSWEELAKGLAGVGALLAEVSIFLNTAKFSKHAIGTATGMVIMAAAMKILASVVNDFGTMSWEEIGKGLVALGVALTEISIAINLMPKNMLSIGTGLVLVGAALEIMTDAVNKLGGMKVEELKKGLIAMGAGLLELSIALNLMKGTLGGSAALLVASAAILVLAPALKLLGGMTWEEIAKGLVTIAGAFTIIGVAATVLSGAIPAILGLSAAFLIISVSTVALGAGLTLIGVGLTSLAASSVASATAFVASMNIIIAGFLQLIPTITEQLGKAIESFLKVISACAPAFGEAFKAVFLTVIDMFVECVPALVEGVMQMILGVLDALSTYAPQIVDKIFDFVIGLLNSLTAKLPELVDAIVDVIKVLYDKVVEVLAGIDVEEELKKALVGTGMLYAIMYALGKVKDLTFDAMQGVLGISAVIAEFAILLAAIGALTKIEGFSEMLDAGGSVLGSLGSAIGQFVGNLIGDAIGGIMGGISSQLPQLGTDLSTFMTNLTPFIEGAKLIDESVSNGVKALAETILTLTAADILSGIVSWLTGGSSISEFGEKLVPFGTSLKEYSETIKDVDSEAVTASAIAGKALVELATSVPNTDGLVSFFTGDNKLDEFGARLISFGTSMMAYSTAIKGIDSEAITSSVTAGAALVELANTVPNTGGLITFLAGDNDMGKFGEQLVVFGAAMLAYSTSVVGIDAEAITASATAGAALVELANTVPNTGGLISFFTGDNDLESFGTGLASFGASLKSYSDTIVGINTEQMGAVITGVNGLIDIANRTVELDTSGMTGFGEALKVMGDNGINGFIQAFTDATERITQAGVSMMATFQTGVDSQGFSLRAAFATIVTNCITRIYDHQQRFETAGAALLLKLIAGINSKETDLLTGITNLIATCETEMHSEANYQRFYGIGEYYVDGFVKGIEDNIEKVREAAKEMAAAAEEAAQKETDENSPSKKALRIGAFFGLGFVNGIKEYSDKAYSVSEEMAASANSGLGNAISKIRDAIDGNIDTQPTIRPVLDLSDVEEKSLTLGTILSSSQAVRIGASMDAAKMASVQNGDVSTSSGNSFNFTQNNYSPKALSRIEIYRQTKNQFSAMGRMVEI